MSIIPSNTDPLQSYVINGPGGLLPPLTVNGLVYNKVYAQTGVIDVINTNSQLAGRTGYTDPNLNIINGYNNAVVFNQSLETDWISSQDFGGPDSVPVVLTYDFITETDTNYVTFEALNVPCFIEIGYYDDNSNFVNLPGSSTFVVEGGSDIYTTTEFIRLSYQPPYTLSLNNIVLRITRNHIVQSINNGIMSNVAYSVGIQSFSVRLLVLQFSDIPSNVSSPAMGMEAQTINTQNRLGFLENYEFVNYPVSNAFVNDTTYWKSEPQPTGDSIVYFYACLSDPNPSTINRLYIDPLYSGCRFNLYFTTETTASGAIDPGTFTWTPVASDFTLRKGIYEISQITATYLKFEFVKLIPEAYDLPVDTVPRIVNIFPNEVEEYYYALENQIIDGNSVRYSWIGNNNNPQTITSTNINSSTLFGLSSNTVANPNSWPSLSALNNSQLGGNSTTVANTTNSYIVDPTMSYKTIDANGNYNGVAYTQFLQRRFPNVQQHNYTQTVINQVWHESYFTGIQYISAFYEEQFDDIRITPENLIPTETDGWVGNNENYVGMDPDDQAVSPWFPTIEAFNSFNIGSVASDWSSFLTDDQVLMNDSATIDPSLLTNCYAEKVGNLGTSSIVQISQNIPGVSYSLRTIPYEITSNLLYYDYANFVDSNLPNWTAGSGTTLTQSSVTVNNGTVIEQAPSFTAQSMTVSGGSFTAAYNFTIPGVEYGGTKAWEMQLGVPALGTVGYASYDPLTSGINYYFLVNSQVSGTASGVATVNGTLSCHTQFYNPVTNSVVSGTTVSGTSVTFVSGTSQNVATLTGTNYSVSGIPSNTIQFVISGTGLPNYELFELGVFPEPTTSWITPEDRANMRVSSLARIMLPYTNAGSYRFSLCGIDANGNHVVLIFHDFAPMMIPVGTWFDVELTGFNAINYTQFYSLIEQVDGSVNEEFYVAAFSPFYHPIRYEYTTISGSTYPNNYQYITGNINDPNYFVSTTSGIPASGIQLRMTALDPNVFISGVSVVPYYKSNPYYAEMNLDYVGNSKTNELESRTVVNNKPYFQNSSSVFPTRFEIPVIAGPSTYYVKSQFIYNSL